MTATDRLLNHDTAPSASDVLVAILRDLSKTHGNIPMHGEHAKRLTLHMVIAAHGDCDLSNFLRAYLEADRHECAVNGSAEDIDIAIDKMDAAVEELRNRFQMAAAYHAGVI